jgi:hypothetical protein
MSGGGSGQYTYNFKDAAFAAVNMNLEDFNTVINLSIYKS